MVKQECPFFQKKKMIYGLRSSSLSMAEYEAVSLYNLAESDCKESSQYSESGGFHPSPTPT